MAKIKPNGALVYADWKTPGTPDLVGCIFNITPPGTAYGTETDEQCLDEVGVAAVSLGDEEADQVTVTSAYEPNGPLDKAMTAWAAGGLDHTWWIKWPNRAQLQRFSGPILSYKPDEADRGTFMQIPIVVLRTTAVVWEPASTGVAIEYPNIVESFTINVAITTVSPAILSGTPAPTVTVFPPLPPGLAISSSTGDITGTPTATQLKTAHAIQAESNGEIDTAYVEIEVNAA